MGKIDLEIFEDKFLKKYSIYYELSILIGVDSLCYSIADKYQQFLGIRKYAYPQLLTSFRDLSDPVAAIIQEDAHLRRSYATVRLGFFHPFLALVPNRLYNEEEKRAYLEKMLRLQADDDLLSDELPFSDAMGVYPIGSKLKQQLDSQFPDAAYCHGASALSRNLAAIHREEAPKRVFFNLRDGMVQVFAFEVDDLLFLNTFSFLESTDLVYYLMLVCQQLGWKAEETPLWGTGLVVEDSAIYRNLQRYFPHFQLLTPPAQMYQFGPRFELDVRKHWFFDLFCVSALSS